MNLSLFDIAFLGNAIRIVAGGATNTILYDLSGSAYSSGSYDIFVDYTDGDCPGNSGYGWNGPWTCVTKSVRRLIAKDILLEDSGTFAYPSGSDISGSDYGYGWSGSWNTFTEL